MRKLGYDLRSTSGLIEGEDIFSYFILDADISSNTFKTIDTPVGVFGR